MWPAIYRRLVIKDVNHLGDEEPQSITIFELEGGDPDEIPKQVFKQLTAADLADGYTVEDSRGWASLGADNSSQEVIVAIMSGIASGAGGIVISNLITWGRNKIKREKGAYTLPVEAHIKATKTTLLRYFKVQGDLEVIEASKEGKETKAILKDASGNEYRTEATDDGSVSIRKVPPAS